MLSPDFVSLCLPVSFLGSSSRCRPNSATKVLLPACADVKWVEKLRAMQGSGGPAGSAFSLFHAVNSE